MHLTDALQNSRFHVQSLHPVLGKVSLKHFRAKGHLAALRLLNAGQKLHQGGFASSIRADQNHFVATFYGDIHVSINDAGSIGEVDIREFRHHLAATRWIRQFDSHCGIVRLWSQNSVHFVHRLQAALSP